MKQGILFFKSIHQQAKFVVVIFCCLLSASVFGQKLTKAPCKNHLKNYSFFMGKMGWTLDNVEASIETSGKNQYLKIGNTTSSNGGMGRVWKAVHIPREYKLNSSLSTYISFWAKRDNSNESHAALLYIYFLDGEDILDSQLLSVSTGVDWKLSGQRYDVPSGTKRIKIGLRGEGNYFDNVCVALSCQKTEPKP